MALVRRPVASIRGPQGLQGIQGIPGLPGVNAVPTVDAMKTYASSATVFRDQLQADYLRMGAPSAVAAMTAPGRGNLAALAAKQNAVLAAIGARFAARSTQPIDVGIMQDSLGTGQGAASFSDRIADRVAAGLRAALPIAGTPIPGGRGWINAIPTSAVGFPWPVTRNAGATDASEDFGACRRTIALGTTGEAILSTVADGVDISWPRLTGGGDFRWRLDAGAWTTVSTAGTPRDGMRTAVPIAVPGAHTVTVQGVTAGAYLNGFIEYYGDRDRGIKVHALAKGGAKAIGWCNGFNGAKPLENWPGAVDSLGLDVLLIALGTNNEAQNDVSTFAADMTLLISQIRIWAPTLPIVLVTLPAGNGVLASAHQAVVDGHYTAAATDALTIVCDLSERVVGYQAGMFADNLHRNAVGYQVLADMMVRFLLSA